MLVNRINVVLHHDNVRPHTERTHGKKCGARLVYSTPLAIFNRLCTNRLSPFSITAKRFDAFSNENHIQEFVENCFTSKPILLKGIEELLDKSQQVIANICEYIIE